MTGNRPEHPVEKYVLANARCKGRVMDPVRDGVGVDYMFRPQNRKVQEWYEATRIVCNGCPVKLECRELCDYIEEDMTSSTSVSKWPRHSGLDRIGREMWGGETPQERFARRARAFLENAAAPA